MLDAAKMVESLKKMVDTMEKMPARTAESPSEVNIGNGVTIPKVLLDKWKAMCPTPPRFAWALLRSVFTSEELQGCSLFGQRSNLWPGAPVKPALDKNKVDAIIGYTCSLFNTTDTKVKASLATMLAKGK
ncbi:BEN domain-containing protein 6-like [Amblyomma americanum]